MTSENMRTLLDERGFMSLMYDVPHQDGLYYIVGGKEYKSTNNGIIICQVPYSYIQELYLGLCTDQDIIGLIVTHVIIGSDRHKIAAVDGNMSDLKMTPNDFNRLTYEMLSMYQAQIRA